MASHQPKELKVLTKHYSKLCHTLSDIDNLLPYFVEENIIFINEVEEINATTPSTKYHKVQKLMIHIYGPLKAGNIEVFHIMLRIMEEHGHWATQQLADEMKRPFSVIVNDRRLDHYSKYYANSYMDIKSLVVTRVSLEYPSKLAS